MAPRILAVVAAVLLVLSVAIATFSTESVSLGQALYSWDQDALDGASNWAIKHLGAWSWTMVMEPLLVRPAWLLPASMGIICVGISASLSSKKTTRRSHRRS